MPSSVVLLASVVVFTLAMLSSIANAEPARFLEARVAEVEHLVMQLTSQMCNVQKELAEKVSIVQLESTKGLLQTQLNTKAMMADQMDDKLLSLRFEQLDAKFNMLQRDMPLQADITRLEQDIQGVQQVLRLENLSNVRESVAQLEMIQKASLNEIDTVKKQVHQEMGRNTADVMCCLEDGLQGLRREIAHHLSPRHHSHSHSPVKKTQSPVACIAEPLACSMDHHHHHNEISIGEQHVDQNAREILACELDPHHECSASFAQLDLNLRMLQRDLTNKEARAI